MEHDPLFDPLRTEMDKLNTPPGVEKELMQAFARQFPRKRRWHRLLPARAWALCGGLSAAGAALLLAVLNLQQPSGGGHAAGALLGRGDDGGLFIALDSAERIALEAAPRLVATEVSRASLAPLGLPLTPENAGDSVRAEMLVAADGHPLALRLSSIN
jgi:hypothetical protein